MVDIIKVIIRIAFVLFIVMTTIFLLARYCYEEALVFIGTMIIVMLVSWAFDSNENE